MRGGLGRPKAPLLAQVAAVLGVVLLVVSVPLPFGENEAGGYDHFYDAQRWYVWNPAHNFLGVPLLLVGIALLVAVWRPSASSRWGRVVLASVCGWLGIAYFYVLAPNLVEGGALYGGPELDLLPTRWVVGAGWSLLWLGTVAYGLSHVGSAR